MTIRLIDSVNIAGAHVPAGRQVTLPDGLEADFVSRGDAVYTMSTAARLGPRLSSLVALVAVRRARLWLR